MIDTIAVIGAGNGGKALAADMALQGKRVRLFEFPEFRANVEPLMATRRLHATGQVEGEAELEGVTCDLGEAVRGADVVMAAVQALAHERLARELAPLVDERQVVVLNPGSTGGALVLARVFDEAGVARPLLVETGTLTYGCRGAGDAVHVYLKVRRVLYGVFPADRSDEVGPELHALFPGLVRGAHVLEAGLNNANPVIHPAVALLNAGRIENQGSEMFFYKDGVSPTVARVIERLDAERMALLRALGCPAMTDPENSVRQGYADSADYFECYAHGSTFVDFRAPSTLDHRYFHEDIGLGLARFAALGRLLGVPTPAVDAFLRMGSIVQDRDYVARVDGALAQLGLEGMDVDQVKAYLRSGRRP